jgi:hypothetical protein
MNNEEPNLSGIVVWGTITNDILLVSQLEDDLRQRFGKIIFKSSVIPFEFTKYYESEMGEKLTRSWLVTEQLKPLEQLVDIKNFARKLEAKQLNSKGQRRINIDPGFLTLFNFVLATTKNYGHRVYIKENIFCEVTLIYQNKSFQPLDWTYPDYRNAIPFFNQVRSQLYKMLKDNKNP